MKTTLKKAGLPALVLLAVLAGCNYFDLGEPLEYQGEDVPVETGILNLSGLEANQTYVVYVYPALDVTLTTADGFAASTDKAKMVGYAVVAAKGTEAVAVLKNIVDGSAKTTRFAESGAFLVTVTVKNAVKYKLVAFVDGNASLDLGIMFAAPAADPGKDKPGGEDPGKDEPVVYTVSFDLNYTGAPNPPEEQEIVEGKYAELPVNPGRTGYTFGGWFTDTAGATKWDFDINTVKEKTILYAKWTRNTYTVTFNTGGIAPTPEPLENVLYDEKITAPVITKTGHTLDGWYKENTKTTKWNFGTDTVTESITLYATWIKNPVVTFFIDGAYYKAVDVTYGDKATAPADIAPKANHDFDGWYTAADYAAKWDFDSAVTEDITLYARWNPLTFAILIADMAADAAANTDKTYTLLSGNETYTTALNLTTANSPASVTIDGGGRVITGSANRITVGAGVTITLKNITFTKIPFTVSVGGTLVLETGSLVTGNEEGAAITVNGESATLKGTLVMKAGASVSNNGDLSASACGVYLIGTGSTFIMDGGKVSGNAGRGSGAGVCIDGASSTFTMNGGEISDNRAGQNGGGVSLWQGTNAIFNMSGGVIMNNRSGFNGGGVYALYTSIFNMTGGEITGNTAGGYQGNPGIGGVVAPSIGGNPWIGVNKASGAGPGWIYDNTDVDV